MHKQISPSSDNNLFWGGNDKALKTVEALPYHSFKAMVDQLLNIAIPINITKDEFLAMPKEVRAQRKRVPYLVPCCFTKTISRRTSEFATHFNLICLDIDEPSLAAPYANSPWMLLEQMMPYNFALYHTASSTTKKPRVRIIVEAGTLEVKHYAKAVNYIARIIGLAEVTRESYVYVQPMYLPCIFKGEAELDIHPLVVYETGGRAVMWSDIRDADSTHGAGKERSKVDDERSYTSGDVLDFLRPAVEGISLELAAEALSHIDPDVGYAEWLEIAAALRHQFPGEQSEQAYGMFDEWSSTGSKYVGEKDTRAKWDSLRPHPVGRVPITIRTLFTRAQTAGWDSVKTQEKCFHATRLWISQSDNPTRLMKEGLSRIITTPMITQAGEEALLNMIVEECRRRFSIRVSLTALRKDMAQMRLELREKNVKNKNVSPPWTKGICYVAATDEFFRHATQERFGPGALDRYYSSKLMPTEEQLKAAGATAEDFGATSKPLVRPQDYMLNSINIPRVYDYVYDPRFPTDTFIHHNNRPYVNTYVPTYPEPDKSTSRKCGQMFMKHMRLLIEEEEYRQTLMDFLAYLVQFPGKKIRWAVVIQGAEGCGKTFLSMAMSAVLGVGHVRVVDNNAVNSPWNDWAYGSQLIACEEIRVAGHNRHDIMNILKPLITNETININQRNRDSRQVDNTTNYILFTNHHDALALTKGDRRYFILKSRLQTKEQVAAVGDDHFTELFNMLANSPGGLRHFFEEWPISSEFDANGHAPRTKYLYEMLQDSGHEAAAIIQDAIEHGQHPLIAEDFVSATALLHWLEMQDKFQYSGKPISIRLLGVMLREEGFVPIGRGNLGGKIHFFWAKQGTPAFTTRPAITANERLKAHQMIDPDDWELLEA